MVLFLIVLKKNKKRLLPSIQKKQTSDYFSFNCRTNISEHKEICNVLKFILTICHDVKRGFSLNKQNKNLMNQNIEAFTITSRRKVKDHLISNKTMFHEFKVSFKMLQYAQLARQKCEVYLETNKSEKEQNKKSKQIEIIDQEIKDTESLRQQADETIKLLEQKFVTCCVNRGQKEKDMSLVSKGTEKKRKSTENQKELGHLEEVLHVLEEKRKKLL